VVFLFNEEFEQTMRIGKAGIVKKKKLKALPDYTNEEENIIKNQLPIVI
jgi:hypothetical protein